MVPPPAVLPRYLAHPHSRILRWAKVMQLGAGPNTITDQNIVSWCQDVVWLGGAHDGYRLCLSLTEYINCRLFRPYPYPPMTDHDIRLEDAALYQSMLTFGLVEAVTRQKLKEEQLVRTLPTGERVLSCENLSYILAGWRERLDALKGDTPVLQEWHDQIEHTLFGAYNGMMDEFIHARQNMLHVAGLDHDTIGKNLYMFAAIAEALTISRLFKHYTTLDGTHDLIWSWARHRISDDIYGRDMRTRGWCPFTIETFSDRLCVLGYAHSQPPPFRPVLYRSHEDCTPRKCVASNVDPGTYRTRHVSEDCACGFAKPPPAEVISAISSSQVPVMRIAKDSTPDGGESLCIQCVPSNDTPYVAISHVWADGLGSNTETGLPVCQLQRLATMTESLISGGSFWIDSLCVPDESQSRKQAIRMMARTYKEARLVLVIDAGIYSCPVNTPLERKLLAILSSAWLQRLWTLQEALLAKEMKFLFRDKVIDFEDMIIEAGGDLDPVRLLLLLEVSRLWSKRQKIQSGFKLSLSDISRSLQRRTSSRVSDETLAIASLLGVDVHKLVHLDASKRMQALLLELRTIPPNIIFIRDGEKLKIPNFSWAPASFMIDAVASTIEDNGRCTPQGLIAEYECIHIDPVTFDNQGPYYLLDIPEDRGFYLVGVATFDKSKTPTCNALLLEKPPSFDQPVIPGALVSLQRADIPVPLDEGETVQVQGICTYIGVAGAKFCTIEDLKELLVSKGYIDGGIVKGFEHLTLCIK